MDVSIKRFEELDPIWKIREKNMKIITRTICHKNLKKYIGQDLKLALEHGITTYETGKQNKGWKGLVLEQRRDLKQMYQKRRMGLLTN